MKKYDELYDRDYQGFSRFIMLISRFIEAAVILVLCIAAAMLIISLILRSVW